MPKEYINSRDFDRRYPLVNPDGSPSGEMSKPDYTSARVTWARNDNHVGICLVDYDKDPDGMDEAVKFLNLDRSGCNRLIQTLRRARDAAFGADA
jgi:hypothetical protein